MVCFGLPICFLHSHTLIVLLGFARDSLICKIEFVYCLGLSEFATLALLGFAQVRLGLPKYDLVCNTSIVRIQKLPYCSSQNHAIHLIHHLVRCKEYI